MSQYDWLWNGHMIIKEMFYIPIKLKPELARASMTTSDVNNQWRSNFQQQIMHLITYELLSWPRQIKCNIHKMQKTENMTLLELFQNGRTRRKLDTITHIYMSVYFTCLVQALTMAKLIKFYEPKPPLLVKRCHPISDQDSLFS
jgi:hypothetical protein